jgi:hypothetical protein
MTSFKDIKWGAAFVYQGEVYVKTILPTSYDRSGRLKPTCNAQKNGEGFTFSDERVYLSAEDWLKYEV